MGLTCQSMSPMSMATEWMTIINSWRASTSSPAVRGQPRACRHWWDGGYVEDLGRAISPEMAGPDLAAITQADNNQRTELGLAERRKRHRDRLRVGRPAHHSPPMDSDGKDDIIISSWYVAEGPP
jgi:hypothetical protein